MVIVVPSLSEGNQGEQPVIAAVVSGWKTSLTDQVSKRIDAEGTVVQQRCADEESPREHL